PADSCAHHLPHPLGHRLGVAAGSGVLPGLPAAAGGSRATRDSEPFQKMSGSARVRLTPFSVPAGRRTPGGARFTGTIGDGNPWGCRVRHGGRWAWKCATMKTADIRVSFPHSLRAHTARVVPTHA